MTKVFAKITNLIIHRGLSRFAGGFTDIVYQADIQTVDGITKKEKLEMWRGDDPRLKGEKFVWISRIKGFEYALISYPTPFEIIKGRKALGL